VENRSNVPRRTTRRQDAAGHRSARQRAPSPKAAATKPRQHSWQKRCPHPAEDIAAAGRASKHIPHATVVVVVVVPGAAEADGVAHGGLVDFPVVLQVVGAPPVVDEECQGPVFLDREHLGRHGCF
jgi:hypothetical protein